MENLPEYGRVQFTKKQIVKNVLIICIGFALLFTAYSGLSMLQSTINQHQGIGVISQAITYATFCVSALLLPKYTIKKLGCKRTIVTAMCCYVPYIAANFHFNWLTMVPSAFLVGLSASVLWSSQCTYFNQVSSIYSILILKGKAAKQKHLNAHVTGRDNCDNKEKKINSSEIFKKEELELIDAKKLQNKNFPNGSYPKNESLNNSVQDIKDKNLYNMNDFISHTTNSKETIDSYIVLEKLKSTCKELKITDSAEYSTLISSVTAVFFGIFGLIFRSSDIWSNLMSYHILNDQRTLDNITNSGNCSCGAGFCNAETTCFEHNLAEPSQELKNILTGVSVLLAFLGILTILLFLDDLERDKEPIKFSFDFAMATCRFVTRKEALLLIPLSSYVGFQQTFYIADFTKSYIACSWGVYHVGLVTICYGIAAGFSSTLSGLLVKYFGRIPVMLVGACANCATNIFLLIWNPLPDQPTQLFITAGLWGISVGILWCQLRAFYGVIFKKDPEAAYAGFYLWDSIGYCVAFSYSEYICTYIKIYILLAVSTVGMIGYLKTEMIHIQRNKTSAPG